MVLFRADFWKTFAFKKDESLESLYAGFHFLSGDYRWCQREISRRNLEQISGLGLYNLNPFAVVVLTSLMAIRYKDITDEELKTIKLDLYDEMMKRKMEKAVRQGIYDFLTYYVSFENPLMLRMFHLCA